MARNFPDWITAYVEYASVTEAPKRMHFWCGVSVLAGAVRRKVWIDMKRFCWYPNFYIIFVAKPGIVSKTTTMDIGIDLLRAVPGIHFGPKVITWEALVQTFANIPESFEFNGEYYPMSAMTCASGELGNLIDPQNQQLIDAYISLWDGGKVFDKVTKTSGSDSIECPWINMIGCTTPAWLQDNVPHAAVGGGFTSRCIFVYGEGKEQYIPWVDEKVSSRDDETRMKLIQDLEHIAANLVGPMEITKEARDWYRPVYELQWKRAHEDLGSAMAEGYLARKQTHMCKTATILALSRSDSKLIELEDLQLATIVLENLEPDIPRIFSNIGKSDDSIQVDKLLAIIKRHGEMPYENAYRTVHAHFPNAKDFEGVVSGAIRAGFLELVNRADGFKLRYIKGLD
jgi:Protein of unknown function (DUF3987)